MKDNQVIATGISLWESLARFSSRKLWNEYITHRNQSGESSNSNSKTPKDPSFIEGLLHVSNMVSEHARNRNKEKELFNHLVNQFKLKFNSKKLFAYGYSIPRKAEDKPSLIPFDVIANGEINWGNSSIKGNGLEFVGAMVFKEPLINELNESLNSIPIKKELTNKSNKRKGRPSNKGLIKSYYKKEKTNIDFSKSKNKIYEELADTIGESEDIQINKDTKQYIGLGYEAINKAIGPLVDKEKDKLSS